VLAKLYKTENDSLLYWEIWDVDAGLFTHWGTLGDKGDKKTIPVSSKIQDEADRLIQTKINEGYFQLEDDQHSELIIQFKEENSSEDLNSRTEIQNSINEALGWTGNGHSTDSDIGNGTINIFASVVDPYIAYQTIRSTIQEKDIQRDFLIVLQKQNSFEVLYPENFVGDFSY
jgi:predicted DNA-binding WGR domain protein